MVAGDRPDATPRDAAPAAQSAAVRSTRRPAATRGGGTTEKPLIQSLVRSDAMLSAIAEAGPGGLGLAEIAVNAGLNKSTAHHLLRTLIALGFVERSETNRNYQIGLRSFQLIWQSHRLRELGGAYHNTMIRLCHRTGETVNLTVPYGNEALVVSSLEGSGVVRASAYNGALWSLHSTACGKVILAHLNPAQRESFLSAPARRFTEMTITDPEALRAEIEKAVRVGYAEEVEEHEVGACCVAVPVFNRRNVFSGAISIAAPLARMDGERRIELAALMTRELADTPRPSFKQTLASAPSGSPLSGKSGLRPSSRPRPGRDVQGPPRYRSEPAVDDPVGEPGS